MCMSRLTVTVDPTIFSVHQVQSAKAWRIGSASQVDLDAGDVDFFTFAETSEDQPDVISVMQG